MVSYSLLTRLNGHVTDCNVNIYRHVRSKPFNVDSDALSKTEGTLNTNKQDTQCTYNVTSRRVRLTIFAVEKQ